MVSLRSNSEGVGADRLPPSMLLLLLLLWWLLLLLMMMTLDSGDDDEIVLGSLILKVKSPLSSGSDAIALFEGERSSRLVFDSAGSACSGESTIHEGSLLLLLLLILLLPLIFWGLSPRAFFCFLLGISLGIVVENIKYEYILF